MSRLLPCLCLLLAACSQGGRADHEKQVPRIVSMSPAMTEMVVELGAGRYVVGRSPFCGAVDEQVPVVGDLLNVHWEHLARVDPTHVLVQSSDAMVDPSLRLLAQQRGWRLVPHLLSSADDIRSAMRQLPDELDLPPVDSGVARNRADGFELMIEEILSQGPIVSDEDVLLISPMEPPLAWGTNTYLGQVAEELGASNALDLEGWSPIGFEDLVRCGADRIIVVSSYEPASDHPIFVALEQLPPDVDVNVLVHPQLNLPATHLPGIMRSFRKMLASEQLQ